MRVFWLAATTLASVGMLASCSGNSGPNGPGSSSSGNAGASGSATTLNLNPDGFAYPNPPGGYGHSVRLGTTPGSVMQNFKFLGYPNGDKSQGLQTISLADFYDPCAKRYALIHLAAAAVWCVPCNEETDALVAAVASAAAPSLASERVVVLQALGDGPTMGVGATLTDLDGWVAEHNSNFTEMLDPNLANLGSFFAASEIPWNCDLDPRTMEILQSGTGWSGDLTGDLALPLAEVQAAPGYPVTATCN
jgi:hypothetical protein